MGVDMFDPLDPTETSHPDAADPMAAWPEEEFRPMTPLAGVEIEKIHHFGLGKPSAIWPYYNINGLLDGYVCRFETTNQDATLDKEFRPYRYGALLNNGQTAVGWHWKGWGENRPLYGLDELRSRPNAPVLVVEGEKKVDAVKRLFPDYVAVSPMNGARSPHKSDWTPVAGRDVFIWPDHDEPGCKFAEAVAKLATDAGAASVAVVNIPAEWPASWDLADEAPDGVGHDVLVEMLKSAAPRVFPSPSSRAKPQSKPGSEEEITREVCRLVTLSGLKYELQRDAVAAKLGIRVTALDHLVKVERGDTDVVRGGGKAAGGPGRSLEFPEIDPWPEPADGAELLASLSKAIREYLILSPHQADVVALWIVFTHAFNAFDFSPKLVIRSPEKRSGKTRLVEVLERLACRPFFVSGISAAALLRVIEQHAPAMLLDEIDTLMKGDAEMAEALRGMINSGFTRAGARFVKNVPTPGGGFEPRAFSTWCPMLLAGIGKLPDTVADRAITIEMARKRPDEKVKRLRARDGGELQDLCRMAARWAADNFHAIKYADPGAPVQLNDRAADAWSPLLAIADLAAGEWPERARKAAIELSCGEGAETIREMLLNDIRDAFDARNADRLASDDLVAYLISLDDRPWPEINRGKPLTQAGLARLLKPLKVAPGSIRLGDGRTPKGYYRRSFDDVFARYAPSTSFQNATTPQARKSVAFGQNQNATDGNGVAFRKRENPSIPAGCGVVADRDPLSPDEEGIWTA